MIWGILKNQLKEYEPQPSSKAELEHALIDLWEKFPQQKIDELIITFQNRLELCIEVCGRSISHLLYSRRKKVKKTDIINPYLLSNENNLTLLQMNQQMHHRWTKISKIVNNEFPIYPMSVKSRVIELQRKIYDYKNYPQKYEICPGDIVDLIPLYEEENEIKFQYESDYFKEGNDDESNNLFETQMKADIEEALIDSDFNEDNMEEDNAEEEEYYYEEFGEEDEEEEYIETIGEKYSIEEDENEYDI